MKAHEAYCILGLRPEAGVPSIKVSYHRMLKRHHPDLAGGTADRNRLEEVVDAYRCLLDLKDSIVSGPSAVRAIGQLKVAQCAGEIASLFHRADCEIRHLIFDMVEMAVETVRFQDVILVGIRDIDPSIRKRALSLYARSITATREEVG